MRGVPLSIALALLLATTSTALAHTPPEQPTAAEIEARDHFDKGRAFYNVGQYDQAIGEFQQAYLLMKEPLFLFNIAQSYRLKGDCETALRFYQNYLREQPDPPILEEVQAAVQICQDKQAQQPIAPPAQPTEPRRSHGMINVMAGVFAGLGVVVFGIGAYLALQAKSDAETISDYTGPWTQEQVDIEARGQRNGIMGPMFMVGGVMTVGSAVLIYYLGHRPRKKSTIAVVPTPDGVHVGWAFQF